MLYIKNIRENKMTVHNSTRPRSYSDGDLKPISKKSTLVVDDNSLKPRSVRFAATVNQNNDDISSVSEVQRYDAQAIAVSISISRLFYAIKSSSQIDNPQQDREIVKAKSKLTKQLQRIYPENSNFTYMVDNISQRVSILANIDNEDTVENGLNKISSDVLNGKIKTQQVTRSRMSFVK